MIHIHFFWRRTAQCCLAALLLVATAHAAAATPAIAAGHNHSLVLKADGSVWAWGRNFAGQLGTGTLAEESSPVQVMTGGVVQIAAGRFSSLVLKADGSVWAWGHNNSGQVGDRTKLPKVVPAPVQVFAPGSGVVAIEAGHDFCYALKNDGSLWGWGWNNTRQLGPLTIAANADTPNYSMRPFQVLSARNGLVTIQAGHDFALALRADGSLWGWGNNEWGQLGNGPHARQWPPLPLQEQLLGNGVIAVAAGFGHVLALRADGSVWSWGHNFHAQLGHSPALKIQPEPAQVLPPGGGVIAVAAGSHHSLALKADGSVWAWGRNNGGQLGDGTLVNKAAPVQVLAPGSGVIAITAAGAHTLALKADGSVWEWGSPWSNNHDQPPTASDKAVPTRMPDFSVTDGAKK